MIHAMGRALEVCARHGQWGLVAGLAVGLLMPGLAEAMRPWLPHMVAILLGITAFRIGFRASVGRISAAPRVVGEVLILQLVLPLAALAVIRALDLPISAPVLAVTLMLAAPAISGSPNFAILMGRDPAPAMQVLVVGTALFPLTALPVLFLLGPAFGETSGVFATSARLIAIILLATGLGFAARARFLPTPNPDQTRRLDGVSVLALAIIVVGLMAGIHPLLDQTPWALIGWLALVFGANLGLQLSAFTLLGWRGQSPRRVPLSIIAGNRNVALFLLALPPDLIDRLLPFIGCYQLPMYLTPLILGRLYRARPG